MMVVRKLQALKAKLCMIFVFTLVLSVVPTFAQDALPFFTPVTGEITIGATQAWTFSAGAGAFISVFVEATTEGFDPFLQLLNSDSEEVISNDDLYYPGNRNALLEGITIPRTGQYQVIVSGFAGSVGTYQLTMTPGYSVVLARDSFDEIGNWQAQSDSLNVRVSGGELALLLEGIGEVGIASADAGSLPEDFYTEVRVSQVTSRNLWIVGITLRQTDDDYYVFAVDNRGQWRFSLKSGGQEQILRDWSTHPAIVAGQLPFTLGTLANGVGFDLFYNGALLGHINDETITTAGQIGLYVETEEAVGSQATVNFDDFAITQALDINGVYVVPERLITGDTTLTVQELERRHVIPAGGQLAFTIPESFVDSAIQGVAQQGLGRGVTFGNFVLETTVTLTSSGGTAGCGLLLRSTEESNYMVAYLDSSGAYGISERRGDLFNPGLFYEGDGLDVLRPNRLLVIVQGDLLHYYVNNIYQGALTIEPVDGAVGNVLINFDLANSTCQFANTWLWFWE